MTMNLTTRTLAALLLITPLAACGGGADTPAEHGEGKAAEAEKGPHRGKMLRDGDFAVEMTVFEDGQPPQFRVFPTQGGKPLDPKSVNLTVTLKRLDGQIETFAFKPENDYLAGQGTVVEPHSFDYEVVAVENGKRHVWKYPSPEGQTKIAAQAAKDGGIEIETVGPVTINETREVEGVVQLATTARSEIRGQFPGRIVSVTRLRTY
jgi:membrane fusion protein, heavy metal efflux system